MRAFDRRTAVLTLIFAAAAGLGITRAAEQVRDYVDTLVSQR